MKEVAESFREVADNKAAVAKLADETCAANPGDNECTAFVNRFRAAADGNAIRAIAEETKARTS